jgi:phenylacetate-CoA ligase
MSRFPQILRHQVVVGNAGGKEALTLRIETNGPADPSVVGAAFQEVVKLRPVVVTLGLGETIPEGAPALVDERTYD